MEDDHLQAVNWLVVDLHGPALGEVVGCDLEAFALFYVYVVGAGTAGDCHSGRVEEGVTFWHCQHV
jgi:hypothetical protein